MSDPTTPLEEADGPEEVDWETLRELSVRPGGLGKDRETIWPKLLRVNPHSNPLEASGSSSEPHHDERQIKLDTERSFVLYPVDNHEPSNREALQRDLHELLVSIFRRRRKLSYFQGYHDIITVLFLTLPKDLHLTCAEKLSLHRLRDSMGSSLEPVLGQLRILQRLLRIADPQYSAVLDDNSPLPYFALSNLLTLFAHDIPTLPLIQHVFDYLLTRHPIASVYLAAAVLLSRKEEVMWLEQEGEEGMVHSLLSSLPDIYEEGDVEPSKEPSAGNPAEPESLLDETRSVTAVQLDETAVEINELGEAIDEKTAPPLEELPKVEASLSDEDWTMSDKEDSMDPEETFQELPSEAETAFSREETVVASSPPPKSSDLKHAAVISVKEEELGEVTEIHEEVVKSPPSQEPDPEKKESDEESRPSSPASSSYRVRKTRVSVTSLLARADALYNLYPPIHPDLGVNTVMGPKSVIFTWSENPAYLPDDDEAEEMVLRPELVVLPQVESTDEDKEEDQHEKERRRRKKLKKPRRFAGVVVERRVMVAGAVLVLGVAMAVYGIRAVPDDTSRHHWRRVGRWVGGLLVGVSERVFDGIRL
ncbi:hypothetical protein NEOLEDRAFT_1134531 [Neolentinus lepideus HHB14362 ss-1]|uniref:Rab-GAP TBC domain-containing protein n=1 Tax=Neolentinus lepideus HHB14362 ss-1 TaxID=1314782 RepID=A0A165S9L8_9AGAM|nr:hypothetical protein NEOLEDRAFT_1134531 [Neolentinus lepideus HHB14362 ss-1]